ncbi:MAG: PepSY-associated TM helix domain-containing protein [Bacteroidales bacterium]|jgi:hypothetical protein|nr:PepSY-associated TM helix domain-containing protein [Bacteroidales bacterium]OQC56431.1 MAG: hypothetical protein BWX51_02112 [Bacteroidetes bacterium ADurb.Bin012]MBP9512721.1 PepSY-associated TM helix domain-containing protein [Bacteroidales bacterium]NMD15896.1 hypothetical protein [Bacteroidales bacterium]HOC16604.1 PepSY-associated TM helix domain-containing protein [Bacteroidales bacterium]
MKRFKWRKSNRVIHRDLGYFFVGMTIVYALSGIAFNHINDWNPSFIITNKVVSLSSAPSLENINNQHIKEILRDCEESEEFKKFYISSDSILKIFIEHGTVTVSTETREATIEKIRRRPLFHTFNYLHYNPGRVWTYFSDFYAVSLLVLATSGLFILPGKNGIRWRGAILAGLGIVVIIVLLFLTDYSF